MTDLAQNNQDGDFVSLNDVSERNGLSRGFLEEIAVPLKEAGLIEAKRGAQGGYRLTRSADEISVGDIVIAIEGPLALVDCLGAVSCPAAGQCPSKTVWANVQRHIDDSLQAISLADVMNTN